MPCPEQLQGAAVQSARAWTSINIILINIMTTTFYVDSHLPILFRHFTAASTTSQFPIASTVTSQPPSPHTLLTASSAPLTLADTPAAPAQHLSINTQTVAPASPNSTACSSACSCGSTAITLQPRDLAIMMQARPTPPQPKMAMVSPGTG